MGVDYSAWIGFGVELEIDVKKWPSKYDGWSVEEVIGDLTNPPDETPANNSGRWTTSFCESGSIGYGGDGQYFLVARSSHQGIGWEPKNIRVTDAPVDVMRFNSELHGPITRLMHLEWITVKGPSRWIAAMWMH